MVYSDHQRLELEKEFHYSRYITIRRKAELATNLGLSERQVSRLTVAKLVKNSPAINGTQGIKRCIQSKLIRHTRSHLH